jgi:hypothetical protein
MAFNFEEVKGRPSGMMITHRQCLSLVPYVKAYDKRIAAAGDGRWPFVFYYYYLEQLAMKLSNEVNPTREQWETPAWKEIAALVDEEPDNVIKGLIHLQHLYSKHDPSEVQKIKDTIEVLKPILAAK